MSHAPAPPACLRAPPAGERNDGNLMLLPDERACEGGINVTVNTVDNLLAGRLQDRSFLVAKFDIEGFEPSALLGAKSILSNEDIAPCWIFAEYNRQMAEASAERHTTRPLNSATALFDILASYQYTAYVIPEVTNASAHLNNEPCQAAYRLQPTPNSLVVSGDYEFWRNDARCMALCAATPWWSDGHTITNGPGAGEEGWGGGGGRAGATCHPSTHSPSHPTHRHTPTTQATSTRDRDGRMSPRPTSGRAPSRL